MHFYWSKYVRECTFTTKGDIYVSNLFIKSILHLQGRQGLVSFCNTLLFQTDLIQYGIDVLVLKEYVN